MGGTIPAVRLPAPRATDGRMLRRILIDVADLDAAHQQVEGLFGLTPDR